MKCRALFSFPNPAIFLLVALVPMSAQEPGRERDSDHASEQHPRRPQDRHPENPGQHAGQTEGRERSRPPQPEPLAGQQPERRSQPPHRPAHAQRQGPVKGRRSRQQEARHQALWQDHRAHAWSSEHRDWGQRGGYRGYRIPEARYRGHFGVGHPFYIRNHPLVMYGGYPRFQFGGLWFSVLDPWPEYWSTTWYDDDDVYIDDSGDGYYLYDRRYPEDRIAITVSLN